MYTCVVRHSLHTVAYNLNTITHNAFQVFDATSGEGAVVEPQFCPSTLALISEASLVPGFLYISARASFGLNRFLSFVYARL